MTQDAFDNIDNILDATLDDLADAPSTEIFPEGAHKVSFSSKIDNKKLQVQITFTYIEPLEISDPTAVPPALGDKNFLFISLKKKDGTANEIGQGELKNVVKALSERFPGNSTREILEAAEKAEVAVVTKVKKGNEQYPDDKLRLVSLEVL
jgi:hypothetical protein